MTDNNAVPVQESGTSTWAEPKVARWQCQRCDRKFGRRPDSGVCGHCRGRDSAPDGSKYPQPTSDDLVRIDDEKSPGGRPAKRAAGLREVRVSR